MVCRSHFVAAITLACMGCVAETTSTSEVESSAKSYDESEEKAVESDTCSCECATRLTCVSDCGNTGMKTQDLDEGAAYLKQYFNDRGDALIDKYESSLVKDILNEGSNRSLVAQETVDTKDLFSKTYTATSSMDGCYKSAVALGFWGLQQIVAVALNLRLPVKPTDAAAQIPGLSGSAYGRIREAYRLYRERKGLTQLTTLLRELLSHGKIAGAMMQIMAQSLTNRPFFEQAETLLVMATSAAYFTNPGVNTYKTYKLMNSLVDGLNIASALQEDLRCQYDSWVRTAP